MSHRDELKETRPRRFALRRARALFALLAAFALTVAGCGGSQQPAASAGGAGGDERLKVVTTVSPLTNIVSNVAGGLVDVRGVVPEGTNSHEFEPAPSVAKVLADADLVFINGLHLEEPTKRLAEASLRDGAELVELGSETIAEKDWIFDFSFPAEGGDPNPHLWTNPPHARRYAEIVKDTLSRVDPANAKAYERNFAAYAAQIDRFGEALEQATASIPAARRKLLTYHDSFAYFARDYGWRVIGAIQPADFAEPTPKEVARLIEQVERERVPAIFGSEVFPSPVLEQIAGESGADYVDDLRDDDLPGKPGEADHSLLALLEFDYTTIVRALGGDPAVLEKVETGNLVSDKAEYAQ